MKKTNIILDDDHHKKLKRYAKKQGRTLGGLVRDGLDEGHRILSKMIKAGFYSPVNSLDEIKDP